MRVLHVTPYFEKAWAYGGIPRAVAVTVQTLASRGHDVTVCTTDVCDSRTRLTADALSARRGVGDGQLEVKTFRNISNRVAYHLQFFTPRGMHSYLRSEVGRFDVGHLHGCHHLPGAIAARHLHRAGVPYVLTPHGTAAYVERRRLAKRAFDATIGRGVLEGATRVVAVSAHERKQLTGLGVDATRVSVIPNPLDMSEFTNVRRGGWRRSLGLAPDTPLIVFLGKITPGKRLDVLISAFSALAHREARLVIAGNAIGYGATLRSLIAAAGIGDRTILPGLVAGPRRFELLADADVVAYPSEHEVFGLVPIEALLCGTPVVVTAETGCGDIVSASGGGAVVERGNVPALTQALNEAIRDNERWRQRAAAARPHLQAFDSARVCTTLEQLYTQIAGVTEAGELATA